jgi:diamine N-acetyltransferase
MAEDRGDERQAPERTPRGAAGVSIRPAVRDDAEALAALAEQTFRDAFAADNDPADMDAYCATAFAVDVQRAHLADSAIVTLLMHVADGALIGYAQLRDGGHPKVPGPAPIELWRFYIHQTHHGRGAARALMEVVLSRASARGGRTLWLGVWERNHRARGFYLKHGFADVGAHEFLLGRDLQVDRLMARAIGPPL